MDIWAWIFLFVIVGGGVNFIIRTGLRYALKPFESASNRYIIVMLFLLFLATLFGDLSKTYHNNWLYLPALVAIEVFSYCTVAWSLIHNVNSNGRTVRNLVVRSIILRPTAAVLLVVILLFQLTSFYIAGPAAFDHKLLGNVHEVVTDFWLWSAVMAGNIYVVGCNLLFLFESLQGLKSCNNTNRAWFKYNSYSFVIIALMGLSYFGSNLIATFLYRIFGWREIVEICLGIGTIMVVSLIIAIGLFSILSRQILPFYEQLDRKLSEKVNQKLRPLYELTLEIFPARHHVNAYTFVQKEESDIILLDSTYTPGLVLDSVITQLTIIRNKLWRAEAIRKAETTGIPMVNTVTLKPVALKQEAALWAFFLYNKANSDLVKELSRRPKPPGFVIPPLKAKGIEMVARYYIKLSKEIYKRRLELPDTHRVSAQLHGVFYE